MHQALDLECLSGQNSIPTWSSRVAVLLLLIATATGMAYGNLGEPNRAEGLSTTRLRAFEFACDLATPMGRASLKGAMASDGSRYRMTIYWIEPYPLRESGSFLRYSDFIVTPEAAHYWIHGLSQGRTPHRSDVSNAALLPRENSPGSAVWSALAILSRMTAQQDDADVSLKMAEFFQDSRRQPQYVRELLPDDSDSNTPPGALASDVQVLNALPHGREYSKETSVDGTLVWQARKAANRQPIVTVTIKPRGRLDKDRYAEAFDPNTLGRSILVPPAHQACWSFDLAYSRLSTSEDERAASRELYDKIGSYLPADNVPPEVSRALDRLRFKTALATDDADRVWHSAEAAVAGLCRDDSVPKNQCLLELGSMSGQIEKRYPGQAEERLRPLVVQMVKHVGRDIGIHLDRLTPTMNSNRWLVYGNLLLEEIRAQQLVEEDTANTLAAKLEGSRLARDRRPSDPCEASASVKVYLTQLDAHPPTGEIDMNDVRDILEKGLAKHYTDAQSEMKRRVVADVTTSVRLIVGEGPFCGDEGALIESIDRFSALYLVVNKFTQPIDPILATFLALSFCDTSTTDDHDVLFSQFHSVCASLQFQINTLLMERGLGSVVSSQDVERILRMYEGIFRRYIDDPLWPAFKFPLTTDEESWLAAKARLCHVQLQGPIDEISTMFKYGGSSTGLRDEAIKEVSHAVQQLLPAAAFLRSPPYPDVSCRYRGGYGFTAIIGGPLYKEGERPRETFRAMKYFHLGHRLEEVVKQERELARQMGQARPAGVQKEEIADDESDAAERIESPSRDDR